MFWRRSFSLLVLLCFISFLHSQTAEVSDSSRATFKSKVQVVLVDVVVTDKNNQPIKGLPSDSFEVFEEGKPQTMASFEEHRGDSTAPLVAQRSPLPPHIYSNAPIVDPPDSINVLLLDGLNTEFGDQAAVRRQMIDYLKKIDPGPRLAIFTLGSRLQMVEGFTADPKALIEALNHKKWGGTPQTLPMLRTPAEDNVDQTMLDSMAAGMASAGGIEALQRFLQEMQATEAATRISLTLDALQQLSRYLTGFRGRKNILWFSGSFPQIDFPSGGDLTRIDVSNSNGLAKPLRDTINMLAAAQVALYPISALGLDTQGMYQAQNVGQPSGSGATPVEKAITGQNQSLNGENVNRYFNNKAADDIASNTGGQAFYNTNGLKEAMAEVVHKGAYYYRLSYSPTDKRTLGRYRRIKVKIKKGPYATPYDIAYRHGYYEENEKQLKPAQSEPETDPLKPLMSRGLPDATEIIYNLRLLRSAVQPASGATLVGDNTDLKGPSTRYGADFVIPVDSLSFELAPDGIRHGNIELTLVVYDHAGRPLNWIVRSLRTSLKPDTYPSVQKTGAQFHQEMDVPKGDDLYLRSGVYDLRSNRAGTLEIPFNDVTNAEDLSMRIQKANANQTVVGPATSSPGPTNLSTGPHVPAIGSVDSVIALANALTETQVPPQPEIPVPAERSASKTVEPEPADMPAYCATLSGTGKHAPELAKVCEFALAMRKKLPNVICDRETKRYWTTAPGPLAIGRSARMYGDEDHSDTVIAKVTYRDGQEYYNDVRIDGKPIAAAAPELSGTWSDGEFATILAGAFVSSSKAEFQYEKSDALHSSPAFVFDFHVKAENNRLYFLHSGDTIWFPEYSGRIWIDAQTSSLLRMERETAYMPQYPIRRMRTEIDYSNVPLGDGTRLVLPTNSRVLICTPPLHVNGDNCARNIVRFTHWHKFRATTNILTDVAP